MKIGCIGVGTIASAIVTGFCKGEDQSHTFYLSPRNEKKAAALSDAYENVTVCASNQEVIDQSELIILAVVPKAAEEILSPLSFRKDQVIVSFMSDFPVARIKEVVGDVKKVVRVLPLPFNALCVGPVAVYPKDQEVCDLFSKVGNIVAIDDESKMETMLAITGVMSAYYGLTYEITKWGEKAGLSKEESVGYTTAFFEALSVQAGICPGLDVNALANEYTPGGLNEMGLVAVRDEAHAYDAWTTVLDQILARLKKK